MTLTQFYQQLLIIQYFGKPNAMAEVANLAGHCETFKETLDAILASLSLDKLEGDILDKIGAIVGVSRTVDDVYPKRFFGFNDNPLSLGFGVGSFATIGTGDSTTLNDSDYLFLVRAKIVYNAAQVFASGGKTTLNEAIIFLFGGGWVTDNKDMSITVYVPSQVDSVRIQIMRRFIPTPQGVQLGLAQLGSEQFFGFNDNPNASGFGVGSFVSFI